MAKMWKELTIEDLKKMRELFDVESEMMKEGFGECFEALDPYTAGEFMAHYVDSVVDDWSKANGAKGFDCDDEILACFYANESDEKLWAYFQSYLNEFDELSYDSNWLIEEKRELFDKVVRYGCGNMCEEDRRAFEKEVEMSVDWDTCSATVKKNEVVSIEIVVAGME